MKIFKVTVEVPVMVRVISGWSTTLSITLLYPGTEAIGSFTTHMASNQLEVFSHLRSVTATVVGGATIVGSWGIADST